MAEETPIKKPRGNPNFQKKKQETQQTSPKMADKENDTSTSKDTTEETPKAAEAAPEVKPTDTLPADLFSDKIPGQETLPLDGEVKVKDYAALPDGTGATPPPSADGTTPASTVPPAEATGAAPVAPLTPAEQESQAKQSVDLALKGYEKLHALGRWVGKVDTNELAGLHAKGDINLNQELPLGRRSTTVGGFFEEYNKGIDENIVVTDEFKDNIRPPLTRIVIKNKLFLSDELYVAMIVAEDLTTKMSMLLGLKKSAAMVLKAVTEMAKAQKESNAPKTKREEPQVEDATIIDPAGGESGWREPDAG